MTGLPAPDIEELEVPHLTAEELGEVNDGVQHLLVRLSGLRESLAAGPVREAAAESLASLKTALGHVQQRARAERQKEHREAEPPNKANSQAKPLKDLALHITQDMATAGHPGYVAIGPQVAALQRFLQALGMPVEVTGRFDSATQQAVRKLQSHHKLHQQSGVVDNETRQILLKLAHDATLKSHAGK